MPLEGLELRAHGEATLFSIPAGTGLSSGNQPEVALGPTVVSPPQGIRMKAFLRVPHNSNADASVRTPAVDWYSHVTGITSQVTGMPVR